MTTRLTRSLHAAAIAALAALALSACAPPANATACSTFESGYNDLADAVRTAAGAAEIDAATVTVIDKTASAREASSGDVRAALSDASDAAEELQQDGVEPIRFFEAAAAVQAACAADGASIELRSLVAS